MALTNENFSYTTFLSADFGDSVGSGFRINNDGKEFIVTAKHVIYNENGAIRSDLLVTSQNVFGNKDDLNSIAVDLTKSNVLTFPVSDLALIELEIDVNVEVNQLGNNIISVDLNDVLKLNQINIASDIILVGFPTSLINGDEFDIDRPLLRSGIVAGINPKTNTFIIDSPAFYGNSGGPILLKGINNDYSIAGIVSRYIPFVTEWRNKHERAFFRQEFYNSGYAICVPLDEIVDYFNK